MTSAPPSSQTTTTPLGMDRLSENPFHIFGQWFEDARAAEINDPDAMALASVDDAGYPSVRMVLLKEWSEDGFVFYTNYESRKSGELLATGKAAFVIHWKSLRRQVRVVGSVEQVPAAQSDAYYHSRPYGSRIGAWASIQSRPLETRQALADRVSELELAHPENPPRPPFWGGFIIRPDEIELWADGEFRLHDRFRFAKDSAGDWHAHRLYP